MRTIYHMLLIGRPVNELIIFCSVVTAGFLLSDVPPFSTIAIAALGAALVGGFGNAINDAVDHVSDAVNKPERPIPSGSLTVVQGYFAAGLHLITGLVLAGLVNVPCFKIAALAALMLLGYAFIAKRIPFVANTWIAYVSALSFIYAMAIVDDWQWSQIGLASAGSVFVFLFHLAREIVKDIEDISGDTAAGIRTFPALVGIRFAKAVVLVVFALLIAAMILAYLWLALFPYFLVGALALIAIPLVWTSWLLVKSSDKSGFYRVQTYLKILMPLGLLVLLIGRFTN
ncbi:MAG: UbiA family prenyltransferase [candidate division Zixibacteria bacterium]|nr:UbiA family prenyltransferase [candidate division Zixibacteria bacterium]MBU1469164.1 UbiA family prenyltransferase [candidate division Zixibacteria bacterium]MBU2625348.1 UbiA family prenyltransferase [candidate division Zixibacteria bacterium]